jgi:hypothetical protein
VAARHRYKVVGIGPDAVEGLLVTFERPAG